MKFLSTHDPGVLHPKHLEVRRLRFPNGRRSPCSIRVAIFFPMWWQWLNGTSIGRVHLWVSLVMRKETKTKPVQKLYRFKEKSYSTFELTCVMLHWQQMSSYLLYILVFCSLCVWRLSMPYDYACPMFWKYTWFHQPLVDWCLQLVPYPSGIPYVRGQYLKKSTKLKDTALKPPTNKPIIDWTSFQS